MKTLKLVTNTISWMLVLVVMFFAGGLILTKQDNQWGIRAFHVETGSMTPTIPVGSLVVVRHQDGYAVNDVITFRLENNAEAFVTHRVASIEQDDDINKLLYETKGDANKTVDPEKVPITRVVGRVVWHAPYLGIPMAWVRTQTGFIALIVVPATILIYSELVSIKNEIVNAWRGRKGAPAKAD
jgi:signal peptidase